MKLLNNAVDAREKTGGKVANPPAAPPTAGWRLLISTTVRACCSRVPSPLFHHQVGGHGHGAGLEHFDTASCRNWADA